VIIESNSLNGVVVILVIVCGWIDNDCMWLMMIVCVCDERHCMVLFFVFFFFFLFEWVLLMMHEHEG
jgi:hypothetical protein